MTDHPTLSDADRWLAAEYALGVLDADSRRMAEDRYARDAVFRAAVDHWHNDLSPMLDGVKSVKAPDRVWTAIGQEIGFVDDSAPARSGLWSNLAFWRGLSLGSMGLAAAALTALIYVGEPPVEPTRPLVATLSASGEIPAFTVRYDQSAGSLLIRTASRTDPNTRVPELWVIPGDGIPRSLGVLGADDSLRLPVPDGHKQHMVGGAVLAITLEQAGGSPTGKPTSPAVVSGTLLGL